MSTYIPKSSRDELYRFFFMEGVVVCKKDRLGQWTGTIANKKFTIPIIQVMQIMRSMKSRNQLREQFAWQHYYWTLNERGVDFLRRYLMYPESFLPNTYQDEARKEDETTRAPRRGRGGRGERGGRGGRGGRGEDGFRRDREGYQRQDGGHWRNTKPPTSTVEAKSSGL